MSRKIPAIQKVSDTAFWVATYRAMETSRQDALFHDPLAGLLAGEYGEKVSGSMKPFARYAYWSVTIRTRLIDDYILQYIQQGYSSIINLGAGLDTRPYRLDLPQDVEWIEIDFPEVIELKNSRLKQYSPNCRLERIGIDLSDLTERKKVFAELNNRSGPALILTEGVIPYLDEAAVSSLANEIKQQSRFKLWITEYYSPEVYPRYQSPKFNKRLGSSPFQFFPVDWLAFFEQHGWKQKEIKYLHDEALKHKRKFPLPWWASALRFIVGEKRIIHKVRKYSAYLVFEKLDLNG